MPPSRACARDVTIAAACRWRSCLLNRRRVHHRRARLSVGFMAAILNVYLFLSRMSPRKRLVIGQMSGASIEDVHLFGSLSWSPETSRYSSSPAPARCTQGIRDQNVRLPKSLIDQQELITIVPSPDRVRQTCRGTRVVSAPTSSMNTLAVGAAGGSPGLPGGLYAHSFALCQCSSRKSQRSGMLTPAISVDLTEARAVSPDASSAGFNALGARSNGTRAARISAVGRRRIVQLGSARRSTLFSGPGSLRLAFPLTSLPSRLPTSPISWCVRWLIEYVLNCACIIPRVPARPASVTRRCLRIEFRAAGIAECAADRSIHRSACRAGSGMSCSARGRYPRSLDDLIGTVPTLART